MALPAQTLIVNAIALGFDRLSDRDLKMVTAYCADNISVGPPPPLGLQVFEGRAPAAPDFPAAAALNYPTGGGTIEQWDTVGGNWV